VLFLLLVGVLKMDENERLAEELAADPTRLESRLLDAKSYILDRFKKFFRNPSYDFQNKRLVGEDGMVLQWRIRRDENSPASQTNTQSPRGYVAVEKISNATSSLVAI